VNLNSQGLGRLSAAVAQNQRRTVNSAGKRKPQPTIGWSTGVRVDRANRQGRRNAVGQSTEYDSFVKLKNQPLSEVNLSEGPSPQWRRWGWGQDGPLTLAVKATQ
jgi:hypothetical protein